MARPVSKFRKMHRKLPVQVVPVVTPLLVAHKLQQYQSKKPGFFMNPGFYIFGVMCL